MIEHDCATHPPRSLTLAAHAALQVRKGAWRVLALLLAAAGVGCGGGVANDEGQALAAEASCDDGYGSSADRRAIEQAMLGGTALDVGQAIAAARATRGIHVGCPSDPSARTAANPVAAPVAAVRSSWDAVHAPLVDGFAAACPEIGRLSPSAAFGAFHARAAGGTAAVDKLADIARAIEATQFTAARAAPVADTAYGAFGGYVGAGAGDACTFPGTPGQLIADWCAAFPAQCVVYRQGPFSNRRFLVADINRAAGVLDGQLGFDHGWAGVLAVEAARVLPAGSDQSLMRASAVLAGEWSVAEPPVRNHNYTAKSVWLLARLYAWDGDARWRTALIDKLERNSLPGVLIDLDGNGLTDGPGPAVAFAALHPVARVPGRLWDAHNAVTHYMGMNTVAVVEAYAALRDRGDTAAAARVRPYALAMLDNLAHEFLDLGMPGSGASQREAGVALALGVLRIAQVENLSTRWEQATHAVWNAGAAASAGSGTAFAGLYLRLRVR